jgi:hypothetical protein
MTCQDAKHGYLAIHNVVRVEIDIWSLTCADMAKLQVKASRRG